MVYIRTLLASKIHQLNMYTCRYIKSLASAGEGKFEFQIHHDLDNMMAHLWLKSASLEFPSQRSMTRSFDVFFDLRLNKRWTKHSRRRWFEIPSHSWWRHCNDTCNFSNSLLKPFSRDQQPIDGNPTQFAETSIPNWTNVNRIDGQ